MAATQTPISLPPPSAPRLTHRHAHIVADLIQYMNASGEVAPGLTHVLSSWKQNNNGRQRDQQGDSGPIYHSSSKSTLMGFTARTIEEVVVQRTVKHWLTSLQYSDLEL